MKLYFEQSEMEIPAGMNVYDNGYEIFVVSNVNAAYVTIKNLAKQYANLSNLPEIEYKHTISAIAPTTNTNYLRTVFTITGRDN